MWNWRVVIIVPAAFKAVAEQAARSINSAGPNYDGDAFSLELTPSGAGPVTHWALYTSATDEMVSEMAAALPVIEGAKYWRHDVGGALVASNVTEATGQPWGWPQSLEAAGLRPLRSSMP